jgi:riboflavin kinase/FMN adenylyltransferase
MPSVPPVPDAPTLRAFTVVRSVRRLEGPLAGAVAAIGNFDGIHRGHAVVIGRARSLAERLGRPCAVFTFEPHPRDVFRPDAPVFRLTDEAVKLGLLAESGLDGAVVLPFDRDLAATTAEAFIDDILVGGLGLGGVVVGWDFHFGRGRAGSPAMLRERGEARGLAVEVVEPYGGPDEPVSSTAIRTALAQGDVERAAALLGWRWLVRGTVVHGDKRGRTLGYPTANILLPPSCGLAHGIYAVRLAVDGAVHGGVASFGRRPTFDDGAPRLEVFVFDFAGDLYDRVVDVEFCAFIRGEAKFDGIDALIAQMDRDSATARAALARAADIPAPSALPLPR